MTVNDFVILILSHNRPQYLKNHTWHWLDIIGSTARRVVVLSDDDPQIEEYKKEYGEDSVAVFSKVDVEKKYDIDLIDCYWGKSLSRKATVWARNEQFKIARDLGYRWFIVLDDDYRQLFVRRPVVLKNGKDHFASVNEKFYATRYDELSVFDHCCLKYFELLNSAPWLYATAFAQCGDFIGGIKASIISKQPWKWKAMNVFFCDTEKEYRFYGRFNDDVNAYILNGRRGQMSLTLPAPVVNQELTQKSKGGMTDIYKTFGTYVKSLTSAVACPSSVSVACMGTISRRIHHMVNWTDMCPRVLDKRYCKNEPLDYNSECLHEVSHTPDPNRTVNFLDPRCEVIEDANLGSQSIDSFF